MKVSYIIVTYRSQELVGTLIDSILDQDVEGEAEIIVVDNSPQSSSEEVLRDRLTLVDFIQNQQNRGYTAALNQGIREANGEYLFLLNPDVVLKQGCARILVDTLKDKNVGAAAPQLLNPDGSIQKSVRNLPGLKTLFYESLWLPRLFPQSRRFGHWRNYYFSHDERREVEQPMASALMLRKDVVEKVGELDEQFFIFFSDVDYCRRLVGAGFKIIFEPAAKAIHQSGGTTRREGPWLVWDSHKGFSRYLRKYEMYGARILLRPLVVVLLWIGGLIRASRRKMGGRGF